MSVEENTRSCWYFLWWVSTSHCVSSLIPRVLPRILWRILGMRLQHVTMVSIVFTIVLVLGSKITELCHLQTVRNCKRLISAASWLHPGPPPFAMVTSFIHLKPNSCCYCMFVLDKGWNIHILLDELWWYLWTVGSIHGLLHKFIPY